MRLHMGKPKTSPLYTFSTLPTRSGTEMGRVCVWVGCMSCHCDDRRSRVLCVLKQSPGRIGRPRSAFLTQVKIARTERPTAGRTDPCSASWEPAHVGAPREAPPQAVPSRGRRAPCGGAVTVTEAGSDPSDKQGGSGQAACGCRPTCVSSHIRWKDRDCSLAQMGIASAERHGHPLRLAMTER